MPILSADSGLETNAGVIVVVGKQFCGRSPKTTPFAPEQSADISPRTEYAAAANEKSKIVCLVVVVGGGSSSDVTGAMTSF